MSSYGGYPRALILDQPTSDQQPTYPARDWSSEPRPDDPGYRSTALRAPKHAPIAIPLTISERTGPGARPTELDPIEADLTRNAGTDGEPIGERIIVSGRVVDESGLPLPNMLIELWQANAAGRYHHQVDQHRAPLDPNFIGAGRCLTDADGGYRFLTIHPGAYPWGNDVNAWRPPHLHFSLLGPALPSHLLTQMYFPGDPLHARDAILNAVPADARPRLIATYDADLSEPEWALGYRWDIVLRGNQAAPETP